MSNEKPTRQVSLTKEQRATNAGLELLNLCQSIANDGIVSKEEIISLTKWLRANREEEIPAVTFLYSTVERIIKDLRVSKIELKELHTSIEKVLPLEIREDAIKSRLAIEKIRKKKNAIREAQEREKIQKAESDRNRPIAYSEFMVAGVHHNGRHKAVTEFARAGNAVRLIRDYSNRHGKNTIRVDLENDRQIGYVPEAYANELAPLMENRTPFDARIKRILKDGNYPLPIIIIHFYREDSDFALDKQPKEDAETFWATLFGDKT